MQPRPGVDQGPIHLVEAGLPKQLEELGWNVHFDGHHQFEDISASVANDPPIGKLKNPRRVSKVCEAVAKVVGDHAKRGVLPVTLGGDHSLVCSPGSPSKNSYVDTFALVLNRQWEQSRGPLSMWHIHCASLSAA